MAASATVPASISWKRLIGQLAQGAQDFLRREWSRCEAHADGVVDGIGNGGRYAWDRRLSDGLGAKRAGTISMLDQHDVEGLRDVPHMRQTVLEGIGVLQLPVLIYQVLEERQAKAHDRATFDLPNRR